MSYVVAIDIGGTFTDVTLCDSDGRMWVTKTPSTPEDPSLGFQAGIEKILRQSGASASEIRYVFHGTTVATNAVLQNDLARSALITTRGFRHVLHIGRHEVPRGFSPYAWEKPERPVTPADIYEINERVGPNGEVLRPFDEQEARDLARRLRAKGYQAIAVCLLHSYANPAHEQAMARILELEFPEAYVSLSSVISPVFREFERSMATVWNAGVGPIVGDYVRRLEGRLEHIGIAAPLLIMKSNGGVLNAEMAAEQPVQTVLSGPAAGVVGASWIAAAAGMSDFISIDVGGTSADVVLVKDGTFRLTTDTTLGGLPLSVPMMDIHTIGAGGGSIAHFSPTGNLMVGPRSAGASPGPVCYLAGGTEPTVTDANLVLGRIPPYLLGGEIPLGVDAAREAIASKVAAPLGISLEEAALGILDIVNNNMAGAIRAVSVERGYDPADFVLIPCGGAGPLFGSELAGLLGVRRILIPRYPGALSTMGLINSDLTVDYGLTSVHRSPDYDLTRMADSYGRLETAARTWLERHSSDRDAMVIRRQLDARYEDQGFEVSVMAPDGPIDEQFVAAACDAFAAEHQRLYAHTQNRPIEFVNLRVTGIGRLPRLQAIPIPNGSRPWPAKGSRPVLFDLEHGFITTPLYDRSMAPAGATIAGPAVIEQVDSTVIVAQGERVMVDQLGNLIIEVGA